VGQRFALGVSKIFTSQPVRAKPQLESLSSMPGWCSFLWAGGAGHRRLALAVELIQALAEELNRAQ